MSSLARNVVDPECGTANPLVGLSKHYINDNAFIQSKQTANTSVTNTSVMFPDVDNVQQFVNEFITDKKATSSEQSFRMDALLREIQRLDSNQPSIDHSFVAIDQKSQQWTQEFNGKELLTTNDILIGRHDVVSPELAQAKWADEYLAETERHLDSSVVITDTTQWQQEFANEDLLYLTAETNKLIEIETEEQLLDTNKHFTDFVKKVGNTDMKLPESSVTADVWSLDFAETVDNEADKWVQQMTEELTEQQKSSEEEQQYGDDDTQFWTNLAKEWKEMGLVDENSETADNWVSDFGKTEMKDEYKFNEENPLKDHPNAFEEGLKKLKEGDIPSAVLLFETAVQRDPNNSLIWQYLGTSQAENEHDYAAIAALNKCVTLDPNNLKALMALAVSYTNESMQTQACSTLKDWIRRNPKYLNFLPPDSNSSEKLKSRLPWAVSSIITSGLHKEVKDLFIEAARQSPTDADPDVQCGLGVLFNLSGEYDRAADCFQAALQVRPSDSLLWNRLGATLANGSQSEEAINAYREALAISPGFIRSRFNLGISCINLGTYREAAEHFLTVLNLQASGRGPVGSRPLMSTNVWSTLRMVMTLMNRSDLLDFVDNRDLNRLNSEFQMNDPNT
ncbi:peroxisomal targeting signal 1 receptor-like [Oppia nitens]|uniref:peroxisomal targeting signal 1 receptor-like n=1 Tax=Oppia nitens TaxID=1686743 RepID=UPI0023DC990E|nr:peroxisomal targeting signal 1 receptor-like [Oppia nitens]